MIVPSLVTSLLLFYCSDSIQGVTTPSNVVQDASYEYKFKLHSHSQLDICNETVKCMMLNKGNIDQDFLQYFVYKIGAIILNVKKKTYLNTPDNNYTSANSELNYEYYRQTGRSIAQSLVDWYLYVLHMVKLNTLADHRMEFLGTHVYADVTNCKKLHQLWAMEVAYAGDMHQLAWRLKDRIRQQMMKLSQHFYEHRVGLIKNYENLTFSMENNELVYGE